MYKQKLNEWLFIKINYNLMTTGNINCGTFNLQKVIKQICNTILHISCVRIKAQ